MVLGASVTTPLEQTCWPDAKRAVLPLPKGGLVVMSAFSGLCNAPDGTGRIDPGDHAETMFAIAELGADTLLVLTEPEELPGGAMVHLGASARAAGVTLHPAPIVDFGVPDDRSMRDWAADQAMRRGRLSAGGTVVVCCRGAGGLVAALLHMEGRMGAGNTIAVVRAQFA